MKLPWLARLRARRLIASPAALLRVVRLARSKPSAAGMARSLKTLLDLAQAWASGNYRGVARSNLVLVVGAVVYFLNPFDLVPDFLVGIGLLDDASVIAWVMGAVSSELAKFEAWREEGSD